MVTIPCTAENKDCEPEDCKCFGLAGNSGVSDGAASATGAVVTAGAALVALLV